MHSLCYEREAGAAVNSVSVPVARMTRRGRATPSPLSADIPTGHSLPYRKRLESGRCTRQIFRSNTHGIAIVKAVTFASVEEYGVFSTRLAARGRPVAMTGTGSPSPTSGAA